MTRSNAGRNVKSATLVRRFRGWNHISTPVVLVLRRRALSKRAPSRRTATGEIAPAPILRDGHAQQAARDLLRMRSVSWADRFHGIGALVPLFDLKLLTEVCCNCCRH